MAPLLAILLPFIHQLGNPAARIGPAHVNHPRTERVQHFISVIEQFVGGPFEKPSRGLPFGTDNLGRDQLSRAIYGARISMAVGVIVQLIVLLVASS